MRAQDGGQPPKSTEKICLIRLDGGTVPAPTIPTAGDIRGFVFETDSFGHRTDLQLVRTPAGS